MEKLKNNYLEIGDLTKEQIKWIDKEIPDSLDMDYDYYVFSDNTEAFRSSNLKNNFKQKQQISFEEFKEIYESYNFVLPEKWCIKGCEELGNFIPYEANVEGNDKDYYYYNHSNDYLCWNITFSVLNGFTEITFEQFKEHVLKEKYYESEFNENTKEIIGYKLVKEEYKLAVREIILTHPNHEEHNGWWLDANFESNLIRKGYNFGFVKNYKKESNSIHSILNKAGVLDLWFEPVYKPEIITLKSGVKLSESDIEEVRVILIDRYAKL